MAEIEMVIERAAEGAVGEDETLAQQEETVSFVAAAHPCRHKFSLSFTYRWEYLEY